MTTDSVTTTQTDLEKLVSDLRGLLASKDLDGIPEIKQLRQRLDDGIHSVRDSAVRAAQEAALQAKDAARAADRYAHDEPNAYAAGEEYFPQEMAQTRYYQPTNRGLEGKIGEKLAWLAGQDQNSPIKRYR